MKRNLDTRITRLSKKQRQRGVIIIPVVMLFVCAIACNLPPWNDTFAVEPGEITITRVIADVFQNGGRIGKTPLKLVYDKTPNKKSFEFRLKNYRTVQRAISLKNNTQLVVTLHPKRQVNDLMDLPASDPPVDTKKFPSQQPKRAKTNVRNYDPEATLNPFD